MDSLDPTPPPPSFTARSPNQTRHYANYMRSVSTKEPSFSELQCTPPRLSAHTISSSLHTSFPSSPANPSSLFTPTTTTTKLTTSYRCISSVLKKDGQILSIASSNGLVYTGSVSNVIRVWKTPEFTECGHLKTKAGMVVALEVSNDRVYAAYADCKIRVWRQSWDGKLKHIRLATIPSTGNFVRSYIAGKDKMMKHMGPISSLAINVADDLLYSASIDKTVKVWRISDLKCIETIKAHSEPINAIIVADDGVLYTASDDATVRVWRRNFCGDDRPPHSLTVTLPAKYSPVKTLTLTRSYQNNNNNSSYGGVLYGGCSDGYVHYWIKGWFSGQLQYGGALQGHTHAVMCLANVSNYLVSGSADSTSRVWVRDQVDGQHMCLAVLEGHRGPIRCVAAFPVSRGRRSIIDQETDDAGCTVCTGSLDGILKVWCVKRTPDSAGGQSTMEISREYFEL